MVGRTIAGEDYKHGIDVEAYERVIPTCLPTYSAISHNFAVSVTYLTQQRLGRSYFHSLSSLNRSSIHHTQRSLTDSLLRTVVAVLCIATDPRPLATIHFYGSGS